MLEGLTFPTLSLCYNVNLVLVELGSRMVRFRLTKSMLMLPFESYMRKHAVS
jgi:hypothetical protein